MSRAWREIDREQSNEVPGWLRFVNRSEIAYHEARGRWHLGDPNRAAEQLRELTAQRDLPPRNEAAQRAVLATALAAGGDFGGAFAEGAAVLPVLEAGRIRSPRTLKRLRIVRQLAAKHTAGTGFREHYDQIVSVDVSS
jgi:hypothetical protein